MTIKKYTKKDGSTAWFYKTYLGVDPITKKKRYTTKRGFKTQKEAKIALSRLQLQIQSKGLATNEVSTFQEIYDIWIEQYKNRVKPSTLFTQTNVVKSHILPYFGAMRVDKITTAYCQKQVNHWYSYYKKHSNLIGITTQILNYAIALKQITENPMNSVIRPINKKEIDSRDFTSTFYDKDQLETFFKLLEKERNSEMYLMFRVLAFTGLRRGEMLALRWSDIDLDRETLSVNQALTLDENGQLHFQTPKNKQSIRTISLDVKTKNYLRRWKAFQRQIFLQEGINTAKKDQLVFTDEDNQVHYLDYPYNFLKKFLKRHDLPKITIHGFRHTHCSLLFEAGATLKEVQERLGHSNINTTMDIYTHVTKKAKEQTAEKYANYVNF